MTGGKVGVAATGPAARTVPQAYRPLVLFYTPFFKDMPDLDELARRLPARWTGDRRLLRRADIVIVHVPNRPDLARVRKRPGQIWIAWSMESAVNYPQLADPAYMRRFDMTMTYEQGADIWMPYLPNMDWWRQVAVRPLASKSEAAPLVMFQSAPASRSGRVDFVTQLFRYMKIDSYGRLLRTRELPGPDLGVATKWETASRYHFCLAFENAVAPDYVTEKIFDAFWAGSVPVYLGAPNVGEFVPEGSYIDATAFSGARDLARYLNHLSVSPEEYGRYHVWRTQPLAPALMSRIEAIKLPPFDRLLAAWASRAGSAPRRRSSAIDTVIAHLHGLFGRRPRGST